LDFGEGKIYEIDLSLDCVFVIITASLDFGEGRVSEHDLPLDCVFVIITTSLDISAYFSLCLRAPIRLETTYYTNERN
jgi:hypothetical protein